MADAAEWGADPERDDQGDSWDGDARTAETGPGWTDVEMDRPPDHVPQLHRAMSEAAADLEAVDDRLSTLFDRTEEPRSGTATRPAAVEQSMLHTEFVGDVGTAGAPTAAYCGYCGYCGRS